jgi:Trk K+ transport system NAD-binding subunit
MNTLPALVVIGCGHWGKHLIRNFHQLNALKLICDKNEDLLRHSLNTTLAWKPVWR